MDHIFCKYDTKMNDIIIIDESQGIIGRERKNITYR